MTLFRKKHKKGSSWVFDHTHCLLIPPPDHLFNTMVAYSSLAVLLTAIGGAFAHAEFSVDEAQVRLHD